jgi:hypothetical protein
LLELWRHHLAETDDSAALLEAYRTFVGMEGTEAFVGVGATLRAWHLLKLGRVTEAAGVLEPYLAAGRTHLGMGTSMLARSWMTRIDREHVKEALQVYYRKEVRYPNTLRELADYPGLPDEVTPPYQDRWNLPWRYKLVGLKAIPGLRDQKYELMSPKLGEDSDLERALAEPYGGRTRIAVSRLLSGQAGQEVLEVVCRPVTGEAEGEVSDAKGETAVLSVGSSFGAIYLAYVGERIVIVCDRDYWTLLPKPKE